MGIDARWSPADWDAYKTTHVSGKSAREIFSAREMKPEYDPKKITIRESRDSDANPFSTPVIIGSDVTGSMGMIAHELMGGDGLNTLAREIYDRKPVPDPHIMVLAIGDAECDRAPLQATQFEADIRLADQVRSLWIEGGGGGNPGESYSLAHLFAAMKTSTDAAEKRGRKGYLFTIGDEPNLDGVRKDQIKRVLGIEAQADMSASDCLKIAQRDWEVFHVVLINEGRCKYDKTGVLKNWAGFMPKDRIIELQDVKALAETVVSVIQVTEGARAEDVAASWSGSTAVAVRSAIGALEGRAPATGVRRLGG